MNLCDYEHVFCYVLCHQLVHKEHESLVMMVLRSSGGGRGSGGEWGQQARGSTWTVYILDIAQQSTAQHGSLLWHHVGIRRN